VGRPLLLLLALALSGCHATLWQARFTAPERHAQLDREAPFLKAHTPSGQVYVLGSWRVDEGARRLQGEGLLYDAERRVVLKGKLSVPLDEIALLETNRPERVNVRGGQYAVMAVLTGVSVAVTIVCAVSPNRCFWGMR
jgi:hypothetical protein